MIGRTFRCLMTVLVASTLTAAALAQPCEFEFGVPENLGSIVNSYRDDMGPTMSADGLELYFFSNRPGGSGGWDLWMSRRDAFEDPWGAPVNLGPGINSQDVEVQPEISADGLTLYFNSDRPGGLGSQDIWMSTRANSSDPWGPPVNLGPPINNVSKDGHADISADGLTLFILSHLPGGYGDPDLWMSTRESTFDPWEEPVNLGPAVNSAAGESGPSLSPDGLTLLFQSDRPGGTWRERDLWMTTRRTKNDPWDTAIQLAPPVNSSTGDSTPDISRDGQTLLFTSARSGGSGWWDLWQVELIQYCVCVRDPEWQCDGDVDGDGQVNPVDAGLVMSAFGLIDEQSLCNYDIDCDEQINPVDAGIVLSLFGTCEPPRDVCP